MSKERELLSWIIDAYDSSDGNEFLYALDEIRAFLAAEPEAEYDFYGVIPLTHRKAKGIIKDNGYHVTGFVLSRPDGDKCIVDMSAVRWLSGKEFFEMMHPPVVSPTAEPEAEPVYVDAPSAVALSDVPETDFGMTEPVAWIRKVALGKLCNGSIRDANVSGAPFYETDMPLYLHPPKPAEPEADEPLTVNQISMMANERAKITSGSSGPVTTPCDIDPFPSEEA